MGPVQSTYRDDVRLTKRRPISRKNSSKMKKIEEGRQLWDRKTENETGFPFIVLKPASSAVGSDGSFLFAAYTRKNVLFAHSTSPLPQCLASQGTDHDKTCRVCSTKVRVLAAKFRRWAVSRVLA